MYRFIILLYKLPRKNESQINACISRGKIISVSSKHDLYQKIKVVMWTQTEAGGQTHFAINNIPNLKKKTIIMIPETQVDYVSRRNTASHPVPHLSVIARNDVIMDRWGARLWRVAGNTGADFELCSITRMLCTMHSISNTANSAVSAHLRLWGLIRRFICIRYSDMPL